MKGKKIFAFLLTVSMLLTAGCSKKVEEIKTVDETQVEVSRFEETQDDFAQFRTEKEWNDDLQGTYKNEKVDISIRANIKFPEYTQSIVMEGKRILPDEKYKESMLKKIFGEEDIYFHDLKHQTMEELQNRIDYDEDIIRDINANFTDPEAANEEWEKEIKELQKHLAKAKNEYTRATGFSVDEYIAKRNGEWYTVRFEKGDNGSHISFGEATVKGPKGLWEDAAGVNYMSLETGEWENTCVFSSQEAEQEVLSFAEKMGISNLVLGEIHHEQCSPYYGEDNSQYTDEERIYGYAVDFGIGFNNELMFGFPDYYGYAGYARVTDDGVVAFSIFNWMEPTRVTEHVSLLSLDKIKSAFKNELAQNLDNFCEYELEKFTFRELTFGYVWQIKDAATGEGAYIPVYILIMNSPDVRLYANAIDGTVLDLSEIDYY